MERALLLYLFASFERGSEGGRRQVADVKFYDETVQVDLETLKQSQLQRVGTIDFSDFVFGSVRLSAMMAEYLETREGLKQGDLLFPRPGGGAVTSTEATRILRKWLTRVGADRGQTSHG